MINLAKLSIHNLKKGKIWCIIEKYSHSKRRVNYIFSKKIKYYTKETIKLTNIIAVGVFIMIAIVLIKMKPTYQVSIEGKTIGYIQNKNQFEKIIEQTFNNNEETNIAFADFQKERKYEFKLVEKEQEYNEEEVLVALANQADITYFQYALMVNGEEKERFTTATQANEVVAKLKEEMDKKLEISIERIYTKELEIKDESELAGICDNLKVELNRQIEEEQRKEKATIDGVYIAVIPVQGKITSRYGARESIRTHEHKGLDIAAKMGTPIKAAADGTVTYSGIRGGYGNLMIIDHGNGITTYYGHCSKLYKKNGETITAGDVIAQVRKHRKFYWSPFTF